MNATIRVLYAEDDPRDADLTRSHFAEYAPEFGIEVVGTGQSCLERLRETGVDLLLLDYRLPDMDGLDVLKTLVHAGAQVPVVLVTGVGDEELVVKALRLGAATYVPKLGNYLETLPDLLRDVLEERRRKQGRGLLAAAPRRILYVEHVTMDIELTLRHFAEAAPQSTVDVAHTCAEALARLAQPHPYDLALIDLRMPDLNGLDFVREANRLRLQLPPFIMITGKGDDATAIAALKLGAADYIAKREGYLDQLPHTIDYAIEHDRLNRLNTQMQTELAERRRVEESLRESRERYELAVRGSSDGIWDWNVLTNEDFFSDRWCEMVGYERAELAAELDTWIGLLHPDDVERVKDRVRRHLEQREPYDVEFRMRTKTGDYRWFCARGQALWNEQGRPTRMAGSLTDITEHKQAEERLRRQAALLDGANDAIYVRELDHTVSYWNAGAERLFGWTRTEALQRKITELGEEGRAAFEAAHTALLEKGNWVGELSFITEAGRKCQVLCRWTLLRDDKGHPAEVLAINTDITEQKALEAQFLQAQKMESVGRLAGGVAHDFNNLLTVINSSAEFALAELKEGDPLRDDLEQILASGVRAAGLTRQLLAFSRKQVLQPAVLNLNTLVEAAEKMLKRLIGEDVDLALALAKDLGPVRADPGQIEQVIVNLAVNARDAMPTGGMLTIETADVELDEAYASQHAGASPGPYVLLAISDTGTGMDEATRTRIFEPFFTTKEAERGTGLGLSTVYGIVRQSGGSIWVYSEIGAGTTFKIYLPRVAEPADDVRAGPAQAPTRGTETVLVVEDDKALRRAARRILSSAGYTVLEAADGAEALRVLEGHAGPLHLLLTDVVMPGLSGREVAERLCALRPGLKVLFSSGYTDDSILRHGVLDRSVHFIAKPFTRAALTRKVRDVLDEPSEGGGADG